jgi:DNA-binding response OmpR family regulator
MKLLLIDDNAALVKSLTGFLAATWQVDAALNGREGLRLAKTESYDVILLDLSLPDIPGLVVCKELRKAKIHSPVLVLSGTDDSKMKVTLLKVGADDYVTKPFDIHELNARLLALLRRGAVYSPEPCLLKADDLVLNPLTRQVVRGGHKITLRRKEFDILEYLLRNRGRVVTRTMIMDNVWDPASDSWNNTVDVHIKCLRDKVDRPFKQQLISTAYGVGYTIEVEQ